MGASAVRSQRAVRPLFCAQQLVRWRFYDLESDRRLLYADTGATTRVLGSFDAPATRCCKWTACTNARTPSTEVRQRDALIEERAPLLFTTAPLHRRPQCKRASDQLLRPPGYSSHFPEIIRSRIQTAQLQFAHRLERYEFVQAHEKLTDMPKMTRRNCRRATVSKRESSRLQGHIRDRDFAGRCIQL